MILDCGSDGLDVDGEGDGDDRNCRYKSFISYIIKIIHDAPLTDTIVCMCWLQCMFARPDTSLRGDTKGGDLESE